MVSIFVAVSITAIERFQIPGLAAYWIGFVSGASILALLEVLEANGEGEDSQEKGKGE